MLAQAHSRKTAIWLLSTSLVLTIVGCLLFCFGGKFFGQPDYFAVELTDGDTWYGQIANEDENKIILDHVYHFHDNNLKQLVSHSDRFNPPKEIQRSEIISFTLLGESSPVLKAIRKFESK
ncbi:MAG: hypothetical protein V2A63_02795 [Patescibacteria group bacterium]